MPVFICYQGDCDNLAFRDAGLAPFVSKDALGRDWICLNTGEPAITDETTSSAIFEMMRAQSLAHRQGLTVRGSELRMIDCEDEAAFRAQLVQETYPPAAESEGRLNRAGWTVTNWEYGTVRPHVVTVTNGQEQRSAQRATANEACHRAAVAALDPRPEEDSAVKLPLNPIAVPLREESGSYRMNGSRVSLDLVIDAFKGGADPETIVRAYDTLALGDVYAVIAYYLANKEVVDAHLRDRDEKAERMYQEVASRQPSREELKAKLLATRGLKHAPVGQ